VFKSDYFDHSMSKAIARHYQRPKVQHYPEIPDQKDILVLRNMKRVYTRPPASTAGDIEMNI
jgi:hypothetical protein